MASTARRTVSFPGVAEQGRLRQHQEACRQNGHSRLLVTEINDAGRLSEIHPINMGYRVDTGSFYLEDVPDSLCRAAGVHDNQGANFFEDLNGHFILISAETAPTFLARLRYQDAKIHELRGALAKTQLEKEELQSLYGVATAELDVMMEDYEKLEAKLAEMLAEMQRWEPPHAAQPAEPPQPPKSAGSEAVYRALLELKRELNESWNKTAAETARADSLKAGLQGLQEHVKELLDQTLVEKGLIQAELARVKEQKEEAEDTSKQLQAAVTALEEKLVRVKRVLGVRIQLLEGQLNQLRAETEAVADHSRNAIFARDKKIRQLLAERPEQPKHQQE